MINENEIKTDDAWLESAEKERSQKEEADFQKLSLLTDLVESAFIHGYKVTGDWRLGPSYTPNPNHPQGHLEVEVEIHLRSNENYPARLWLRPDAMSTFLVALVAMGIENVADTQVNDQETSFTFFFKGIKIYSPQVYD